jgi:hypothetical protein
VGPDVTLKALVRMLTGASAFESHWRLGEYSRGS